MYLAEISLRFDGYMEGPVRLVLSAVRKKQAVPVRMPCRSLAPFAGGNADLFARAISLWQSALALA